MHMQHLVKFHQFYTPHIYEGGGGGKISQLGRSCSLAEVCVLRLTQVAEVVKLIWNERLNASNIHFVILV